jgi:hypothetical protein
LLNRTPKNNKKQRLVVESDDDDAGIAKFNTPTVKLGKKGEPLAPCGRPALSANPVNKTTTANTEIPKTRTGWAEGCWILEGPQE